MEAKIDVVLLAGDARSFPCATHVWLTHLCGDKVLLKITTSLIGNTICQKLIFSRNSISKTPFWVLSIMGNCKSLNTHAGFGSLKQHTVNGHRF